MHCAGGSFLTPSQAYLSARGGYTAVGTSRVGGCYFEEEKSKEPTPCREEVRRTGYKKYVTISN